MKYSIGVDIGGTKVAIAIVNQAGTIEAQTVIPTDLSISPEAMINVIAEEVQQIIKYAAIPENEILGMGIGAPGPLDSKQGIITCPPNLKEWVDIPVVGLLQQSFTIPITLENDANAAALAEKWVGAGKKSENFIYMTISTGIGAGIIADGKLLKGLEGNAGEIGHTVIDPSFGKCSCGQYGCLESIASGTAIAKRGSEMMDKDLSTKEVFDLYTEGNVKITDYIESVFRVLGVACVTAINTFDPEKIIIGGGVSKVGDPLFQSIQAYISQYALNPTGRNVKVVPAQLEQNAGVIGAAALCFD